MGRNAKPWFRKATGWWYVEVGGRQMKLAQDKKAAKDRFHELFANRDELQPQRYVRDLLDEYLEWCEKNRAEATYAWYTHFLSSFSATIKKQFLIHQLQPLHVTKWAQNSFVTDTTRNRAITAVVRALTWAVKQGYIRRNPIHGIEKPAAARRELTIDDEQFEMLLAKTDDQKFRDLLDAAWETGCRPQEVVKVEARHFDEEGRRWVFPSFRVEREKGGTSPST